MFIMQPKYRLEISTQYKIHGKPNNGFLWGIRDPLLVAFILTNFCKLQVSTESTKLLTPSPNYYVFTKKDDVNILINVVVVVPRRKNMCRWY